MHEIVERYRFYAAQCLAIAQDRSDSTEKLLLLDMAQCWLKLAEQAAQNADTVLNYETAVPEKPSI